MDQESAARFTGTLQVEMLEDGRLMRLLGPFGYVDPGEQAWPVPEGTVTDGASIPRALWAIVGGPFEGAYRKAAVVHDYYCDARTRPWMEVHRMFYDAMLTAKVGARQAQILYYGVRLGGPRWNAQTVANTNLAKPRVERLPLPANAWMEQPPASAALESDAVPSEKMRIYADTFEAELARNIELFAQATPTGAPPAEIEARAEEARRHLAELAASQADKAAP